MSDESDEGEKALKRIKVKTQSLHSALLRTFVQQHPPSFFLSLCASFSLFASILIAFCWFFMPLASPPMLPTFDYGFAVTYGSFSTTMTWAMWWNTSFTFKPVFAEVSKKVSPCYWASCCPCSEEIILSGRSHLFATSTLATFELACCSICFSQFAILLNVDTSEQSYTRIIPIAPL